MATQLDLAMKIRSADYQRHQNRLDKMFGLTVYDLLQLFRLKNSFCCFCQQSHH